MAAQKQYEGPYLVETVSWSYDGEIEGWQVVSKPFFIPNDPLPHRTVNSQIYEHRTAAYRRCAQLNQGWQERQAKKVSPL